MSRVAFSLLALTFGFSCASCTPLLQASSDPAQDVKRAGALVQSGQAEQAIPIYKNLAAQNPSNTSLQVNLVVALFKAGHYQETVSTCEDLVRTRFDLFPAWLFLGAARLKLGNLSAAELPLRKALALKPNDPNAQIMLADVLSRSGQNAEAASLYLASSTAASGSPRPWYGLFNTYEGLAHDRISRLQHDTPASAETLALSAEFDLAAAQVGTAFQHLRQALARQPDFCGLHARVASIYFETGHPDWAAIEQRRNDHMEAACPEDHSVRCNFVTGNLQEAAAATPASTQDIYWQARALLALSQQALGHLKSLGPSRESWQADAQINERRGRYPEATTAWKNALQLDPLDASLQRSLALALCHSNDCASALPILQQMLAREQSSELNYLCGLALIAMRDPQEAIPYLETAIRLDDKSSLAKGALGEALLEAGRPREALPKLQFAAAEDNTAKCHYQLARAYRELDMRAQAEEELRRYREQTHLQNATQATQTSITPP